MPSLQLYTLSFLGVYFKKIQPYPRKMVLFPLFIVVLYPLWALADTTQKKISLYTTVLVTFMCAFRYHVGHVVTISFTLIMSSAFSISSLLV